MNITSRMQSGKPRIQVVIEPLGPLHDRAAFSCGNAYIDREFHQKLQPQISDGLLNAFVAVEPGKAEVLGFYAIRAHEIAAHEIPSEWDGLLTAHSLAGLPAAYIALFGTRERCQDRGIGRIMLADALRRIKRGSNESLKAYAVILDALDEKAADFYAHIGFQAIGPSRRLRMFFPVSKIL